MQCIFHTPTQLTSLHNLSLANRAAAIAVGAMLASIAIAIPTQARAETGVQLYGTVDAGMAWTRTSGSGAHSGLLSGGQSDSLWGLQGKEVFSGGSYARFVLEGGIDLNTGSAEDPARTFNQQAWLGLGSAALGELRLGRQHTVGQAFISEAEIGSWKDFGMGALMRAADNYQVSNQLSWRSPQWAGGQIGASYSFAAGEQGDPGKRTKLYSLAARYEGGPWLLAASVEQMEHTSLPGLHARRPTAWQLSASYDMDSVRLAVSLSRQRNGFVGRNGDDEGPATLEAYGLDGLGPSEFIDGGRLDAIYIGAAITLGAGELQLQWSQGRPDWVWQASGKRARPSQVMSAGYVYALSSRTSLYAFAAHGRRYSMDAVVSADAPHTSRVALGVTHSF